jgi:hypothetical protein
LEDHANDDNIWATEVMGNARYPLELFLRVVTVSLETNRIRGRVADTPDESGGRGSGKSIFFPPDRCRRPPRSMPSILPWPRSPQRIIY